MIAGAAASDLPDKAALARLGTRVLLRPWPDDVGHPLSTAEALAATLPNADTVMLGGFDDEPGIRQALHDLRRRCDGVPDARPPR